MFPNLHSPADNSMAVGKYLSLVKFSHTVFALPFALSGFAMGVSETGHFDWRMLLLILGCMVTARNAAMGFNRWADRDIDAQNDRTRVREIPAGVIKPWQALTFVIVNCIAFIGFTWFINALCFWLSPVALLVIIGYSLTKRFTAICHLVLGLGLGLAPVGAYIAVTEHFSLAIILLGFAVLTWTGGFDIIYALQDEEFDKQRKLFSIPAWLGRTRALLVSTMLHVVTAISLITFGLIFEIGWIWWSGVGIFLLMLAYQHFLVKPGDLSRVNLAFFTTNGIASVVLGGCAITDLIIGKF